MDKKEQQLINHYYEMFSTRNFDEKDVYSFLMLIKTHVENNTTIENLLDFLIHRENSTGYALDYLNECKDIINNLGKTKVRQKIEPLFSFKDIRNGFNTLFQELGLEKLPVETMNDLMLCIISLLQGVRILSENGKKAIGHLSFAASSKELFLMGNMAVLNQGKRMPITFPVLSVNNRYEKITPQDAQDTPYLFDHEIMEVVRIENQLMMTFPNLETK